METIKKLQSKRKPSRPLTGNEKFLLSALAIVLVIFLSNKFLLTPQAEEMDSLEAEKFELDVRIADMNATLKKENNLKKEKEVLYRERNDILANYFPILDQSQIIYLLNDLIKSNNMDISDYQFTSPVEEQINEMSVKKMEISLPYEGNYDGIMSVMESVKTSPRRIIIDSMTMDKTTDSEIGGNMGLKIYSLEGLADIDPNVIFVNVADGTGEGSMFNPYAGYVDPNASSGETGNTTTSTEIDESDYVKVYKLHDFETRDYSFVATSDMIKGDAVPSTVSKSGKYSLRVEYNMLALEEENRVYVDLSKSNIEIKYPADFISMWVNAYGYSPGTLGMRFRTQGGEDVDVTVSEGISWIGWSQLETSPPADLNLYPLKLSHIYYELPYNRDDFGVFLIDKLEAIYPADEDKSVREKAANFFYVVEPGDSLSNISKKFYGTEKYKDEIMKNNSIATGDILSVGRVLVLVRR